MANKSVVMKMTIILMAVAISMTFAGCGKKASEIIAEKAIEAGASQNGEKVDVDISKGEMTIKGKDGEQKMNIQKDGDGSTVTVSGKDGFKMKTDDNGATMEMADGGKMTSGDAAKLPDNFPADVPMYEGMKLIWVMTTPDEGMSVTAETADAPDKVTAFYKEQVAAKGWTEKYATQQDTMFNGQYSKDGRDLIVMVMKNDDKTGIQLTIAKEQK